MTGKRLRCGAPVVTLRDIRKQYDTCRRFVAREGEKCYHHRVQTEDNVGHTTS